MRTQLTALMALFSCIALMQPCLAVDDDDEKGFGLVPVNTESGFMMRLDVDSADRTYRQGDKMRVRVKSEKDCYLYLLYFDAENECACLFPNEYQKDNFIRAGEVIEVPGDGAAYDIECQAPFGTEVLKAVGTLQPVDIFQQGFLTKAIATPLKRQKVESMAMRLKEKKQRDWAEARLEITTYPREKPRPPQKDGKYGVYIGISEYESSRVPQLRVSHKDAERMAETFFRVCGVETVALLTNEQATSKAIEQAIFKDLVAKTGPGDTVYLFFSGHGGRCADTNGDENDGFDEYLVPHDGVLGKPETMVMDDAFARWMQELDGRKIAIIFDCCYSGGSSKGLDAKGLAGGGAGFGAVDFFDGEMRRSKDLGQRDTMVLAACQANQLAWEMPKEDLGSVLTYYVLTSLGDSRTDTNGDGKITLGEIYRHTKPSIEDYVQRTFSADQNPLLVDNANDSIVVRGN